LIVDGAGVPARSKLSTEICIVGAGAAGITLAQALADLKMDVIVLESGGLEPEDRAQDLAHGETVHYPPLETTRMRMFGGSTMHWGGWCRPLEASDFEHRPWVPHSGWPIDRSAVLPYYPRAQEICQVGEFQYDPEEWNLPPGTLLPLASDRVHSRIIQFSPPTRFGIRYRAPLTQSTRVTVYLNTTATRLKLAPGGRRIEGIAAVTFSGNTFEIVAKRYILAGGGIDNPRLMLASNDVAAAGVGNDNDLVGRFFADHMQLDTAVLLPIDPKIDLRFYQLASRSVQRRLKSGGRGANLMGYLTLDRQVQESRHTLNYSANLFELSEADYASMRAAAEGPASGWDRLTRSISGLWHQISTANSTSENTGSGFYKIVTTQEQAPNPASRVRLSSNERDAFGMPRPLLEWRFTDLDRDTIEVALDELSKAFGANSLGRIQYSLDLRKNGWPANVPISWHHCGTTRMSTDPKQGVVDPQGRVHGLDNLYVAGSSVFPTNGHGNPTLTIVALALRLAEYLGGTVT
jgi:choline dehydrogenase-like flavoprotein